jgi:hypothetical protein
VGSEVLMQALRLKKTHTEVKATDLPTQTKPGYTKTGIISAGAVMMIFSMQIILTYFMQCWSPLPN